MVASVTAVLGQRVTFKVVINVLQMILSRNCVGKYLYGLLICKWGGSGSENHKCNNPNKNQVTDSSDLLCKSKPNLEFVFIYCLSHGGREIMTLLWYEQGMCVMLQKKTMKLDY